MNLTNLIVTILTSGAVSALISGGFGLRGARLNRRHAQTAAARDALTKFYDVCVGFVGRAMDETLIQKAESALLGEVDKCADDDMTEKTAVFVEHGKLYAAGDDDSGLADFDEKRDALRDCIRERMKKLN